MAASQERIYVYLIRIYKKYKIQVYRTIIFAVVLCGCKTFSLTLKEEHWLRVFKNGVLREIFGPKRGR